MGGGSGGLTTLHFTYDSENDEYTMVESCADVLALLQAGEHFIAETVSQFGDPIIMYQSGYFLNPMNPNSITFTNIYVTSSSVGTTSLYIDLDSCIVIFNETRYAPAS